jgi:hypothetical protein
MTEKACGTSDFVATEAQIESLVEGPRSPTMSFSEIGRARTEADHPRQPRNISRESVGGPAWARGLLAGLRTSTYVTALDRPASEAACGHRSGVTARRRRFRIRSARSWDELPLLLGTARDRYSTGTTTLRFHHQALARMGGPIVVVPGDRSTLERARCVRNECPDRIIAGPIHAAGCANGAGSTSARAGTHRQARSPREQRSPRARRGR